LRPIQEARSRGRRAMRLRSMPFSRWLEGSCAGALLPCVLLALDSRALAGDFDVRGIYHPAANAIAFEDFESPTRYVPDGTSANCMTPAFVVVSDATSLSGMTDVKLHV